MAAMLAAREAVGNYQPPKAVGEVRYVDDSELRAECADFRATLDQRPGAFVEPFMTAPSPGIIAAAMKNEFYDSFDAYLTAAAGALQLESPTIPNPALPHPLKSPHLSL